MPTYYQEVRVEVDQEWIDEHASFEPEDPWHDCNDNCDHDDYSVWDAQLRTERRLSDLIYEVKYLRIHDDKSSLELLELLAERMES